MSASAKLHKMTTDNRTVAPTRVRCTIDQAAIAHNCAQIQRCFPAKKRVAVIKSQAYGHGLIATATTLQDCEYLGVADIAESWQLRDAGIQTPVVVMGGYWTGEHYRSCAASGIFLVVYTLEQLAAIVAQPDPFPDGAQLWLKFNTGMNRLGIEPATLKRVQALLGPHALTVPIVVMTHVANADGYQPDRMTAQWTRWAALKKDVRALWPTCQTSVANSGALRYYTAHVGDIIRPGLMLYGVYPRAAMSGLALSLKPAMTLQARIVAIRTIASGEAVGYGSRWVATHPTRIAQVGIGYGDGYYRYAKDGTPVLTRAGIAPLVGRVSMNMIAIDVTAYPTVTVGEWVTLWGKGLPIETIESFNDAASYDLLIAAGTRF